MRYVVLIFGLLGVVGSGFLGYKWRTDLNDGRDKVELNRKLLESELAGSKDNRGAADPLLKSRLADFNEKYAKYYSLGRAVPFLLASAVLGLFGTFVSFSRHGLSGAVLLIVTGAGPGAFAPPALVFTGSLILAGILSLFVRPRRPKVLAPVEDMDEVEE